MEIQVTGCNKFSDLVDSQSFLLTFLVKSLIYDTILESRAVDTILSHAKVHTFFSIVQYFYCTNDFINVVFEVCCELLAFL